MRACGCVWPGATNRDHGPPALAAAIGCGRDAPPRPDPVTSCGRVSASNRATGCDRVAASNRATGCDRVAATNRATGCGHAVPGAQATSCCRRQRSGRATSRARGGHERAWFGPAAAWDPARRRPHPSHSGLLAPARFVPSEGPAPGCRSSVPRSLCRPTAPQAGTSTDGGWGWGWELGGQ